MQPVQQDSKGYGHEHIPNIKEIIADEHANETMASVVYLKAPVTVTVTVSVYRPQTNQECRAFSLV